MAPKKAKAVARGSTARRGVARPANVAKQTGLAMSTPQPQSSSRAKTPRRAAARGKWSEEQLLTSDKSVLIDLDLVKLLSQPQAWNCLEENEKQEILALLPPDIHPDAQAAADDPNTNIPPIPDNFIRYSNNWRDGVRQFQLDLENGRYDPEWLQQAQDAREQRERGEFDNFKEREYEEFWGQKQKVFNRAAAGESARVKLGTLISEGVILLGDIWRFYYVYGRGPGRIVIEKEVRIDGFNGAKLTFAVPPGERVFLHSSFDKDQKYTTPKKEQEDVKPDTEAESKPTIAPSDHQMKDAEPHPEATNPSSQDEEMKDAIDIESQEAPVSSNGAIETDVNTTSQEIPASSNADSIAVNASSQDIPTSSNGGEMQINTKADANTGLAVPAAKKDQEAPDFSVVIVSPRVKAQSMKRPMPPPDPQPPVKRKRGRPRKNPLPVQPEPQPEPEVQQEPELSQEDQPKPPPPVSSLSILAAEIEKNNRAPAAPSSLNILAAEIEKNNKAAAEPSQPEPINLEPSTVSSLLSPPPQSPEPAEELPNIPTQGETVEISAEKPDTPVIATEAPTETSIEIDAVESNAPTETTAKANHAGPNEPSETPVKDEQDETPPATTEQQPEAAPIPSQFTTNETGEIILSNITSPQALVLKILAIDGRMPNGRTANAWKELRCYRNNQDMGSLFDVREAWFVQQE